MQLVPIGLDARPLRAVAPLDDLQRSTCESTVSNHGRTDHEAGTAWLWERRPA